MKFVEIKELYFPEVKVIGYARFCDNRGYFTEHFRKSDILSLEFLKGFDFVQCNESYSRPGTIRGLHFQWAPYQGKLVRTVYGRMVDLVMDIRKGSPTFGTIIAYNMPSGEERDYGEWIWVPPGFAHGNFYTETTKIEYFCTGEYNPATEAGISPLSEDIDWSKCDDRLRSEFKDVLNRGARISEKDQRGYSLSQWLKDSRSENFIYGKL
ncbi:MAG: dTDP-4-dehydrorhamnose 3,5-epimerase [bacterium]